MPGMVLKGAWPAVVVAGIDADMPWGDVIVVLAAASLES